MPRFDGQGPIWGGGPGAGYGMGPCGAGMGWRRGFGWGRMGGYRLTRKDEAEMLSNEEKDLEEDLKAVKQRLSELRGKK